MTARDPSQMKGGGALDFDGDALLALDDDDAEDALKTDDGDALDVSFDALDMNMDAPLKGPNGTPLSDMAGFRPAKNGIWKAVGADGFDALRPSEKRPSAATAAPAACRRCRPLQGPIYAKSGRRRADE